MKGIKTQKSQIRKRIFEEVARLGYEGGDARDLEELPFKIIPGEIGTFRSSVFLERAVVGQRLRAAMGLSIQSAGEHVEISDGLNNSMIDEKYYEPPLIDVIPFACAGCELKQVSVTNMCKGCFEHPCVEVCPKKAISMVAGKSTINQDLCIKCGKCAEVCPYHAIVIQERPCAKACGINAIASDEYGRAHINHNKCVSCGQCLASCPFGAIVDKGQIYQTIKAINSDTPVYAIIAPAFLGQFKDMTPGKIRPLFKELGFADVYDVAIGADLCTMQESGDFINEVPEEIPYMGTSCCPAWAKMVKNEFPDQAKNISMAMTPMVLTARYVKNLFPDSKVCFIGPCTAKKLEASRKSVKSYVDFVMTFEELSGMMAAKNIIVSELEDGESPFMTSAEGWGFATAGGVAKSVVDFVHKFDPERVIPIVNAEGLANCKKMVLMAKAGKYNGYLLEGMACPGGCIAGAGTIAAPATARKVLLTQAEKMSPTTIADPDRFGQALIEAESYDMSHSKVEDIKEWKK